MCSAKISGRPKNFNFTLIKSKDIENCCKNTSFNFCCNKESIFCEKYFFTMILKNCWYSSVVQCNTRNRLVAKE